MAADKDEAYRMLEKAATIRSKDELAALQITLKAYRILISAFRSDGDGESAREATIAYATACENYENLIKIREATYGVKNIVQ